MNNLDFKNWLPEIDGLRFSPDSSSELQRSSLNTLTEEGYVVDNLLSWKDFYTLCALPDYSCYVDIFALPKVIDTICISLHSHGALSDKAFHFSFVWTNPQGARLDLSERIGPYFNGGVIPENLWQILCLILEFNQKRQKTPGIVLNKAYWGKIRGLVDSSHVKLDGFLLKTIVVTPQSLRLKVNQTALSDTSKQAVSVEFDDMPKNWERFYEASTDVKPEYSILESDGSLVHVVLEPRVQRVLKRIRDLSDYGASRDELFSFISDPLTYLDDSDRTVLEESDSDVPAFTLFTPLIAVQSSGKKITSLLIEFDVVSGPPREVPRLRLLHSQDFRVFVDSCKRGFDKQLPVINWKGVPVSLVSLASGQIDHFESLCSDWEKQETATLVRTALDLSKYGERVIGFGEFVAKKLPYLLPSESNRWVSLDSASEDIGECPAELSFLKDYGPEDLHFIQQELAKKESTLEDIELPHTDIYVPYEIGWQLAEKIKKSILGPTRADVSSKQSDVDQKKLKGIITSDDELNEKSIQPEIEFKHTGVQLPDSLRKDVVLKPHQRIGVAWLQHLYRLSQTKHPEIKGCLLADDMGLGKTLQLLVFIINLLEKNPKAPPALVVAPVALLLNWKEEIQKFFSVPFNVLTLYGQAAHSLSFSRMKLRNTELHDYRPQLKEDWWSGSRIVLTTYETLRTYQMPLARTHFSVIVCDEAQKIKNPSTMVHSSAVALQAQFKISCTGTPVENSLVDLWSVFDFCSPQWLPSLSAYSRMYVQKQGGDLEPLRKQIDPLTLHRQKADCIQDLPQKVIDEECQHLVMLPNQYAIYAQLIASYKARTDRVSGDALKLLHKLRLACAHPDLCSGNIVDCMHADRSPKFLWLFDTLRAIREKNEKVIIFTENRSLQSVLSALIRKRFNVNVPVVNGSVKVNSSYDTTVLTREKIINQFREEPGFAVIILSGLAVGFGVNIQEANHVIHFTRMWNPAKEDQATDRVYRIGQKKPVHVYYPTVCIPEDDRYQIHYSFDEVINSVLNRKRDISHDILTGIGADVTNELISELAI